MSGERKCFDFISRVGGPWKFPISVHNVQYVNCGGYLKFESRSALDCVEEVVLGKLKCQVARVLRETGKILTQVGLEPTTSGVHVDCVWDKTLWRLYRSVLWGQAPAGTVPSGVESGV